MSHQSYAEVLLSLSGWPGLVTTAGLGWLRMGAGRHGALLEVCSRDGWGVLAQGVASAGLCPAPPGAEAPGPPQAEPTLSGLRYTSPTGSQQRVDPLQRSG